MLWSIDQSNFSASISLRQMKAFSAVIEVIVSALRKESLRVINVNNLVFSNLPIKESNADECQERL